MRTAPLIAIIRQQGEPQFKVLLEKQKDEWWKFYSPVFKAPQVQY
jgi:hypothetical protein